MVVTIGLATAASRLDSAVAPMKAPTKPGTARIETVRESTLPSLWCEAPETSEVPISEKWTAAEAAAGSRAGATPTAISSVEEVCHTPYPIPQRAVDELCAEPDEAEHDEPAHGQPSCERLISREKLHIITSWPKPTDRTRDPL